MKKLMKKISLFSISLMLLLSGIIVKAYEQDITISNNIIMDETLYSNIQNYITLNGSLKNDSAVVNQQYISITKEQFDAINNKAISNKKYVDEQFEIIEKKNNDLKKEEENLQVLKEAAEKEGATQEEKNAYSAALATYNTNVNALKTYVNDVDKQTKTNDKEYKKLVPSYDDTKWKKLNLLEQNNSENKYGVDFFKDSLYFISWVKVSLGGNDYYQFEVYCYKSIETEKYYCKIVDGKYYNSEGKEVTEEEYKKDCDKKNYCEIINGKYYDNNGNEVTEEVYKKECEPEEKICKIENGKYYNNDGKEVTEEEYKKVCNPENPKTGLNVNYLYAVLIPLVALSSYVVIRKAKKFSK